jgi:1-acyl-sn-glycerol-3-phosphate acyltransferase
MPSPPVVRRGGPVNVPVITANIATRGNALTRWGGRTLMRLTGWRFTGEGFPDLRRFVLIVAPHTSNWDFIVGVQAMYALGIRGTFLGKDSLFKFPLGIVMRFLGGIPVDRTSSRDVVTQSADQVANADRIILVLAPEGTRKRTDTWRTGFYWIARKAEVPIVPVAFDFSRKAVHIFAPFTPTLDAESDMAALKALYRPEMGRYPAGYGVAG